ncbi:MAG: hypothetical protein M3Y07_18830, partial [Acidobacteriota bacterium]|nr:hypothetical protein [Acidobacteriota bacterium]
LRGRLWGLKRRLSRRRLRRLRGLDALWSALRNLLERIGFLGWLGLGRRLRRSRCNGPLSL